MTILESHFFNIKDVFKLAYQLECMALALCNYLVKTSDVIKRRLLETAQQQIQTDALRYLVSEPGKVTTTG